MTKYRDVIYLDGDDFYTFEEHMRNGLGVEEASLYVGCVEWVDQALEYLLQWEHGEGEVRDTAPWGGGDDTYTRGNYVVSVHGGLCYVSLTEVIPDDRN